MIYLTRLDGAQMLVNPELLWTVEATPDTVLTFTHGKKMVVKESLEDLRQRVVAYRREILWLERDEVSKG